MIKRGDELESGDIVILDGSRTWFVIGRDDANVTAFLSSRGEIRQFYFDEEDTFEVLVT